MPKRKAPDPAAPTLLDEIRRIEECSTAPGAGQASLCVLRVVQGLDAPAWSELSARHGLAHWSAVPLGGTQPRAELLAQAIGQLAEAGTLPDLHAFLRTEIERARACQSPVALVLIQPDAAEAGTGLLDGLLELARGLQRSFDHATLQGGTRLALVFSGASLAEAERLVGSILRRIRAQGAALRAGTAASLPCSAGLAGYGGLVEISPDEFLASAELALADARNLGGNRLEVAAPLDVNLAPRDTLVHASEKHFLFTGKKAGES